jgi:chemotaxis protein methyltransferase CheR
VVFSLDQNTVSMQPEEFRLLRDFISGYCGLYFDEASQYFLERRLQNRLVEKQLASFLDYYYLLLYGPEREEELGKVVDVLTTNETYFFREENQLKTFSEEILPEVMERRKLHRRIRIWSAGCSTGEEPYTLAMLVLENPQLADWQVEIFGSDISQRVLQTARKGVYTDSSFRATSAYHEGRYFKKIDSNRRQIDDRVRKLVHFGHLNLLQPEQWTILSFFDIIFCRNVMIYFNLESKKKMVDSFHHKLCDGGFVLLGHAESMMNISTAFVLRHFRHDMVYQKPEAPPPERH